LKLHLPSPGKVVYVFRLGEQARNYWNGYRICGFSEPDYMILSLVMKKRRRSSFWWGIC
jgi:hypothetical protein